MNIYKAFDLFFSPKRKVYRRRSVCVCVEGGGNQRWIHLHTHILSLSLPLSLSLSLTHTHTHTHTYTHTHTHTHTRTSYRQTLWRRHFASANENKSQCLKKKKGTASRNREKGDQYIYKCEITYLRALGMISLFKLCMSSFSCGIVLSFVAWKRQNWPRKPQRFFVSRIKKRSYL